MPDLSAPKAHVTRVLSEGTYHREPWVEGDPAIKVYVIDWWSDYQAHATVLLREPARMSQYEFVYPAGSIHEVLALDYARSWTQQESTDGGETFKDRVIRHDAVVYLTIDE